MRPMSGHAIFFGALMAAVCAWGMVQFFFFQPPGNLQPDELSWVTGRLDKIEEVSTHDGYTALQLWLRDWPLPFRCIDGTYPAYFEIDVIAAMVPGSHLSIGLKKGELDHPRRDPAQKQSFLSLIALKYDHENALSLESYNQWSRDRQRSARWLLPLMFCASMFLLYKGLKGRRTLVESAPHTRAGAF